MDRRNFLQLISLASAGLVSACEWNNSRRILYPYVVPPDKVIPGVSSWYASICNECPAGCGTLLKSREGRPVKIEGMPGHPINNGRLCARGHAALQGLYNPDRVTAPLKKVNGQFESVEWEKAKSELTQKLKDRGTNPNKIGVIAPLLTGTELKLFEEWIKDLNITNVIYYEPISYEYINTANSITFNKQGIPQYDLSKCDTIISFNCDFLETWLSPVKFTNDFSKRREPGKEMSKFVYVGPRLSLTASNADKWYKVNSGSEFYFALAVLNNLLASSGADAILARFKGLISKYTPEYVEKNFGINKAYISKVTELIKNSKRSVVLAGEDNSPSNVRLMAVANLINFVAGNFGDSVYFGNDYSHWRLSGKTETDAFVSKLKNKEIDLVINYKANPVYSLPKEFTNALANTYTVSFATYYDDTVDKSDLVIPVKTIQETWGDSESIKSVYNLHQPVLEPFKEAYAAGDLFIELIKKTNPSVGAKYPDSYLDYLKNNWKLLHGSSGLGFEQFFRNSVETGGLWKELPREKPSLSDKVLSLDLTEYKETGLKLLIYPSIKFYDGKGANKPWLEEIPDPITSIVWDSWVEMNKKTAETLGCANDDIVSIESNGEKTEFSVYIYDGLADNHLSVPMGLGHASYGRYATASGNTFLLTTGGYSNLFGNKIKISKTGYTDKLVNVAGSPTELNRDIVLRKGIDDLGKKSDKSAHHDVEQIYPPVEHKDYRWGMVIDLNKCTACGACTVACYAENNIPVVGKEQVSNGREMSWIQIHKYIDENSEDFALKYMPMLCQHCTAAPCETVCPVYAAYHSEEGLNVQVYNRCIGTRYCANNCPYKVRRFNWFTYERAEPLNWQLNPDVTVREKGVMEKCTFCVQRLRDAKLKAKEENRPLRDGEALTACQQTCPAEAITFGNLLDENSAVSKLAKSERSYYVLEHLNTIPGIKYMVKVVNKI